jgi:propanediol dehydratase small subunit
VDDDEGEMALELGVRRAHRLGEVARVVALDEVRDDLCVGLGREHVAGGRKRVAKLTEVLDDPVQDDRDLVLDAAGQRMGVLVGDLAVRRPARVADAGRRRRAVEFRRFLELVEVPDRSDVVETLVLDQAEPGRVVAAVLESLEALE